MSGRIPSDAILGASAPIADLRRQIQRLAAFDAVGNPHVPTVLLQGETGTGKGLVARVLHDSGARARNPFIDVNCAAIPDTMLEAELFGFEAGSFTDARRAKPGLFEAASSGTLFLDEIDSLSPALQAKLLKAIEEKRVRRLGAVEARRFDVKLIAATQAELEPLVAAGRFRADLYHRLAVLVLRLPPLRERPDDAVLLAERFLDELSRAHALPARALTADARRWLCAHDWPGNVRELSHLIERVTLLAPEGDVDADALRRATTPLASAAPRAAARTTGAGAETMIDVDAGNDDRDPPASVEYRAHAGDDACASSGADANPNVPVAAPIDDGPRIDAAEAARIRDALRRSGGNVVNAARLLGLGRNALRYRMRRLGIEKPSLAELARPATHAKEGAARPAALGSRTPAATAADLGLDEPGGWEQKRAATLAIDVYFPPPDDAEPRYEPWTALARWRQAIRDKLHGFGAVLLGETGSRISAALGVPRALEQTPLRAVQAALAIQHLTSSATSAPAPLATSATSPAPELRIAVHLGDVRFDRAAPELSALPLGDTLALPERLLGHAGAGEILVSARLARQVEARCLLEARALRLGPRAEDAITAYAVGALRPRPAAGARRDPAQNVFVGRERELAMLEDAFRSAEASNGQVVFVSGEAGLGKSRLLGELRERLAGRPHLWVEGRCAPYGAATPFLPVIDGLRRFFAIDDRDDEASARDKIAHGMAGFGPEVAWASPFIEQTLSVSPAALEVSGVETEIAALDSASRRSETFRALRAVLLRAAEQQPVVVVIEDLHWIDRTSEEYLTFVADVLPTQRVLMVCTHRPGYAHPFGERSYHARLTLRALSEDDMAAMTRALLGTSDMPAELRALVARKAEGNPFFVEEVTRSLLEEGALRCEDGHVVLTRSLADVAIPDTIQDVLTARIDRLADDARHAIQVASVIGREFALRLLERISEVGEQVHLQLDELRSVELIYEKALHPELAYMFKHALTHDVAYQSVVAERRRQLHRTIGLAIEELYADRLEEHYETLAHHFARGDDLPRALLYHDRAAEKAADRHATEAVIEHARRALAIADRLGDAAPGDVRCRLEARLALASFYSSDFAGSAAAFERAAAAAPVDAAPSFVALAAQSHFWAHAYDASAAAVAEVLRPDAPSSPGARAMALNVRGFHAAVLHADFDTAHRDTDAATRLAAGRFADVEASVRFNRTLFAEWTGNYREAIALAEQVMAAGKELRLAHLVVWPYWFLGKARCCLGDYGGAIAQLEEGYQICDRIGDRAWKSRLLNTLGWCLAEIGAYDTAREYNLRAAQVARALGDPEIVSNSEINLALDALALGASDDARGYLEPIEAELARDGDPWMRWRYALHTLDARAQIELARRAPEAMLDAAERELAGARHHHAPKIEARALVTRGRALLELERSDDAQASLEEALAVAGRIHTPRQAWRAHALLATLHERRGRRDGALRHATLHRELLDAAARTIDDAELRRRLHASASGER